MIQPKSYFNIKKTPELKHPVAKIQGLKNQSLWVFSLLKKTLRLNMATREPCPFLSSNQSYYLRLSIDSNILNIGPSLDISRTSLICSFFSNLELGPSFVPSIFITRCLPCNTVYTLIQVSGILLSILKIIFFKP